MPHSFYTIKNPKELDSYTFISSELKSTIRECKKDLGGKGNILKAYNLDKTVSDL